MKKKILIFIAGFFIATWLNAQSLNPSVMSAGGEQNQTETLSLEWTLGELAIDYLNSLDIVISEGFHQSFLEVIEIPYDLFFEEMADQKDTSFDCTIDVWPNPTQSILNIKIESEVEEGISLELIDILGQKIMSKENYEPNGLFELDFSEKKAGTYLLKFLRNDGSLIKTIINIKH